MAFTRAMTKKLRVPMHITFSHTLEIQTAKVNAHTIVIVVCWFVFYK